MKILIGKKKSEIWYEEIPLQFRKIWPTGRVHVITIPEKTMKKHKLKDGDYVFPILLKRRRRIRGELKEGEERVIMKRKDRVEFEQWQKIYR